MENNAQISYIEKPELFKQTIWTDAIRSTYSIFYKESLMTQRYNIPFIYSSILF